MSAWLVAIDSFFWARRQHSAIARGQSFAPPREGLFDNVRDLRDLIDAHEGIDFRQELGQIVAKALRQAARNNEALGRVGPPADGIGFQDGVNAFLLRGIDEGAGIDNDNVGACRPRW